MTEQMSSRERFHATFEYGRPDRTWLFPQWVFPETRDRWLREGMPWDQHFNTYWGYDRYELVPLNLAPWPALESKVIETGPGWNVREDELGGITKLWTDRGIGMSQWIRYPVRGRDTWEKLRARLDADAAIRYPEYWEDYKTSVRDRNYVLRLDIGSFYGWIRNWVGMEHLALWYFDCPDLVHEMTEYVADFILKVVTRALEEIPGIDCAHVWEDMAMKTGPLISPQLFRDFMLEPMKRVTRLVNQAGVEIIMVDSDGNNDDLVSLWLEAGVNLLFPLEVAAGSDPVKLRAEHGEELLLIGGIDKRALRDGCSRAGIEAEVRSKEALIREGGYSPLVDHAVPPDVPFTNFRYYMDLVHEVCG